MSDEMPHSISEGKRMVVMLQKRNEELKKEILALRDALKEARDYLAKISLGNLEFDEPYIAKEITSKINASGQDCVLF